MAARPADDWRFAAFRWGAWVAALLAMLVAAQLIWRGMRDDETALAHVRQQNALKLAAARERVAAYLAHVDVSLRTMALHRDVRAGRTDSHEYLQAVFAENYARHQLSEVYVIERSFDGSGRPSMTFELGDGASSVEEIHSPEREAAEYAVQIDQIRRFERSPELSAVVSRPVMLCVGEPGIVYSVPIFGEHGFFGIVAGMIPARIIDEQLAASGLYSHIVLESPGGDVVARSIPDDGHATARLAAAPREPERDDPPAATGTRVITAGVAIADGKPWKLRLVSDESAELRAARGGVLLRWLPPPLVLLLGAALTYLCRVAPALIQGRQEVERGRQRDAELAHLERLLTVSELSSGLAHELAQPVAAIATLAEACSHRARNTGDARDELLADVGEIANQAQRAGQIIHFLRGYVRKPTPERAVLDLNRVASDVVKLLSAEARRRHVALKADLFDELPRVEAARVGIEQVLVNLIRNALTAAEHATHDRREVVVRTLRGDDDRAIIEVSDSGAGLTDAQIGRIFEPFFTTRAEGLGLGLSICRMIVDSHDGDISARRNAQGGMTFRVVLNPVRS